MNTPELASRLATQELWDWSIAVYLFLGGMGAGVIGITAFTRMYLLRQPALVIWGVIAGIAMLAVGSLLLLVHLLDPLAVWRVLMPWVVIQQPHAWISWGTQFIVWLIIFGWLFAWPSVRANRWLRDLPVLGGLVSWAFDLGIARWADGLCARHEKSLGWLTVAMAAGTAVYTGLLLGSFPAVALWSNPAVPVLFTVSALSTALAFLILVIRVFLKNEDSLRIAQRYERIDLLLITGELALIVGYFYFMLQGNPSADASRDMLWGSAGWVWGFVVLGLVVPLVIELIGLFRHWRSPLPVLGAASLVLVGGYLLRHYFLYSGVYHYPW